MLDYESIKRLGLDHLGVDPELSSERCVPVSNNHIILIHLLKHDNISCPICHSFKIESKGSKSQDIQYSSALEDNITIKLYRRVYHCKACNCYFKEDNPFTSKGKSVSIYKEYKILNTLKSIEVNYTSVAERFHVSPTFVIDLFDRKVDLPRLPFPEVMCVDEVYSKKLSFHHYCFIIYDPINRKIIDVLDSRSLDDLIQYFADKSVAERNNVKYFSMDLYDNYRKLAKKCFPNAKICADPFHVIKNLSQFFHRIRIKVMRKYSGLKDQRDNYYWLFKKYWKLLTIDRSKLNHKKFKVNQAGQLMSTHEIVDYMLKIDPKLNLAYELLHEYRNFNEKATPLNAAEWLDELILKFQNSFISEYIPAWSLLKNWRNEIINSFDHYQGRRISNGPMERANRDIKTIFRLSFGSNNFPRMRNRIMYVMNSDSYILYTRKKESNKHKGKKRGKYKK